MKTTTDGAVLALAVLLAAAAETLIRDLLIPLIALALALLGACPAAPAAAPRCRPPLDHWAQLAARGEAELSPLTVAQLRARARAAGLPRSLSHRGRRAALLQALAGAEVALI